MVRILTIDTICQIVQEIGIQRCLSEIIDALAHDYGRWLEFEKAPRHASHFSHGVIELMPICDQEYYAFKYVNGHPLNPQSNKLTVVAVGMLSKVDDGYPLMISEMTLLTAMRTAATSGLAARYLAKKNSPTMAMIGTGSQAEFQVLAHQVAAGVKRIQYYDIDSAAMRKFAQNLAGYDLELVRCQDALEAIQHADIITTATADKRQTHILNNEWIHAGVHINGIGGDCPGKTEIDPRLLLRSKIVVEYLNQTMLEGEIQNLETANVHAELWEIVTGRKSGRVSDQEITLFDSVGFALEDYTILKYFYQHALQRGLGEVMPLIAALDDPKDLFGLVR